MAEKMLKQRRPGNSKGGQDTLDFSTPPGVSLEPGNAEAQANTTTNTREAARELCSYDIKLF